MVHEDFKEMIPAYALSALDAADGRVLSEHLSECSQCRVELQDWESTAAALAYSASPAEPSPQVRERLMAAVHAEVKSTSSAPKGIVTDNKVLPFREQKRSAWSSAGSWGAIAAALLFVALLISLFVLWQQNRQYQDQIQLLAKQITDARSELDHSNKIVAMLMKPGSRLTELAGTKEAPNANAKLAYDKNGQAMLMVHGLPAAPAGKEYQLWYIVGSNPMPGKAFAPDSSGDRAVEDQIPQEARSAAVFAITLEPMGGLEKPTGAIYLKSSL